MRILQAGYRAWKQEEADAEAGVDAGDREGLARFDDAVESGEFDQQLDRTAGPQ